jgi:hypothetical protein
MLQKILEEKSHITLTVQGTRIKCKQGMFKGGLGTL